MALSLSLTTSLGSVATLSKGVGVPQGYSLFLSRQADTTYSPLMVRQADGSYLRLVTKVAA